MSFFKIFYELGLSFKRKKYEILKGFIISIFTLFALFSFFKLTNLGYEFHLGMTQTYIGPLFAIITYFSYQIFQVAIWEEIISRGYIQNFFYLFFLDKLKLKKISKKGMIRFSAGFAIFLSAVVFTSFHFFGFNPVILNFRILNLFFGGLLIGYIFYKTENLWMAIFAHAAYNTLNFLFEVTVKDKISMIIHIFEKIMINNNFPVDQLQQIIEILKNISGV